MERSSVSIVLGKGKNNNGVKNYANDCHGECAVPQPMEQKRAQLILKSYNWVFGRHETDFESIAILPPCLYSQGRGDQQSFECRSEVIAHNP